MGEEGVREKGGGREREKERGREGAKERGKERDSGQVTSD